MKYSHGQGHWEMRISRNLKLVTHSTDMPLVWMGQWVTPFSFLKSTNELLSFVVIQVQIIVSAPCSSVLYLFPVLRLIIVTEEPDHPGVICKLDYCVGSMHRPAVMGKMGIEEWAQHTAVWSQIWVMLDRKSMIQSQIELFISRSTSLVINLEGMTELKSTNSFLAEVFLQSICHMAYLRYHHHGTGVDNSR